jgi:sigma-B regulation protein RsbU (phosphoserine phosphatase)
MNQPRILVVDDAPQNIHLLRNILKSDFMVIGATSGQVALELALREPKPDLILLDVVMPELDGYQVCKMLKENQATRTIPVIFLTGVSQLEIQEQSLQLGAVDFILKPFQSAVVKMRIHNQLQLKQHRETEQQKGSQTHAAIREKLEHELDVARRLQLSMLACDRFVLPGKSTGGLAAVLRPAHAVGGDLYDYSMLDPNRLLIVLGDVSDKGVDAALFMVRALTLIRSVAVTVRSPGDLLTQVNAGLCKDNDAMMFVTVACCIIQLDTMEWTYSSGGHEPPLLLEDGQPTFLDLESGPALGLFDDCEFPNHTGKLAPSSILLLYTDGVTEAESASNTHYGTERLIDAGRLFAHSDPGEVIEGITKSVQDFIGNVEQSDDMTMLAIKAPGAEREKSRLLPFVA